MFENASKNILTFLSSGATVQVPPPLQTLSVPHSSVTLSVVLSIGVTEVVVIPRVLLSSVVSNSKVENVVGSKMVGSNSVSVGNEGFDVIFTLSLVVVSSAIVELVTTLVFVVNAPVGTG